MSDNDRIDVYTKENLRENFKSCLGEARRAVDHLDKRAAGLPYVDENGHSDSPHAEENYAAKEEAEESVRLLMKQFIIYKAAIEEEMGRSRERLINVSQAEQNLHYDAPRRELSKAELAANGEYEDVVRQHQKAIMMIERMASSVNAAATKKWPLGNPRKRTPAWGGGLPIEVQGPDTRVSGIRDATPEFRTEIGSLLSSRGGSEKGSLQ